LTSKEIQMNKYKIPKYHDLILRLQKIQTTRAKKLFSVISEKQPIAVQDIWPIMGDVDNTAISKELKYLLGFKLVKFIRKGKYKFFEVDLEGVERLNQAVAKI